MILVSTGTIDKPFSRLTEACLDIFNEKNINERVIIQTRFFSSGVRLPNNLIIKKIIPHQEMISIYKKANLIISAAGQGSAIDILRNSKYKPIFFPRLKQYREHVNNQQLQIARKMSEQGYAFTATNRNELSALLNYKKQSLLSPFDQNNSLKKLTNNLIKNTNSLINKV
ncbi:MAG: glycosyltransferase [Patescibacteria group bacterium]|nr:glycosyltransferase [Patescibacteria group bacterium]